MSAFSNIEAKYKLAQEKQEVVDVSDIHRDGTHIRVIPMPKGTTGTKKMIGKLAFVSNNYAAYLFAMQQLAEGTGNDAYLSYADEFRDLYGDVQMIRTPRKKGVATPRRQKEVVPFPLGNNTPQTVTNPVIVTGKTASGRPSPVKKPSPSNRVAPLGAQPVAKAEPIPRANLRPNLVSPLAPSRVAPLGGQADIYNRRPLTQKASPKLTGGLLEGTRVPAPGKVSPQKLNRLAGSPQLRPVGRAGLGGLGAL